MSFKIGTATDYADLLNILDTFLTATGMALTPSFVGTGNGTIDAKGGSAGVAETITVTFTSATAFGVVGSVSGSLGTGVVGTPFTSTKANLTITAGGTAFVATDAFTFAVTPPWTSKRRTSGSEMIWQAPGNGGLDQILVGAKVFSDVGADYYNWRLGGFIAFDTLLPFNQQSGYVGGASQSLPSPVFNLWNSSIPYWIVANGRRVIVIAKVSTVYVSCYLGLLNPYMSPGAFPYPLVVGGSMAWDFGSSASEPVASSTNWRWSYSGIELSNFAKPKNTALSTQQGSSLRLRLPSGAWQSFGGNGFETQFGRISPYSNVDPTAWDIRTDLDGGYTLFPAVIWDQTPNQYGELDGVFDVTGFQQSSENTVTIGGIPHLVVQNVFRTSKSSYFAVKLA
jgi:hypothetical protein